MTDTRHITIGLSTHRPETLAFAAAQMQQHQAILLEEPEIPGFEQMLQGRLAIEDYLREAYFEYPEFSQRSCRLFQTLHQDGKQLFQVDPYLTELNAIHDLFADGGKPRDIEHGTLRRQVYDAERHYSAALMAYYENCLVEPFDEVVALAKQFAREDARRGRVRDRLRAEAIAALIQPFESVYVEAGLLHLSLVNQLRKRLPTDCHVRPAYLMAPVIRQLSAHRQALGPGDKLTLRYTYRPDYNHPRADLLAAQSLIHTKIIIKQEMTGLDNAYPHTHNEIETAALVRQLDYHDCEKLYDRIKHTSTEKARVIVWRYRRS